MIPNVILHCDDAQITFRTLTGFRETLMEFSTAIINDENADSREAIKNVAIAMWLRVRVIRNICIKRER